MTTEIKLQNFADRTLKTVAKAVALLEDVPSAEKNSYEARYLTRRIQVAQRTADRLLEIALEISAVKNGMEVD